MSFAPCIPLDLAVNDFRDGGSEILAMSCFVTLSISPPRGAIQAVHPALGCTYLWCRIMVQMNVKGHVLQIQDRWRREDFK